MLTVDYDRFGLRAKDRLLDLGCGFGRHTYEALARGADVVSCDMSPAELESIRNTAPLLIDDGLFDAELSHTLVQGDGTTLPFADGSFDKVIASEVLEHVVDDDAAFSELLRVLKPGGVLAVTVPAWLPEKICWKISSDYHAPAAVGGHVRIYTEKEVRQKLRDAGFNPTVSHRTHALHSPYWWLRCAVGVNNEIEDNFSVRTYHKLLEWDIVKAPWLTRTAERIFNPVLGKSLVVYATVPVSNTVPVNAEVPSAAEEPAATEELLVNHSSPTPEAVRAT
ncbi:MAG: methyltransferase domain-containing protein [Acidimicrobiaceae bacterium]|nr:methyltransferase domain-containing protein [Acidimicrobiaceae bacterium]